MLIIGVDYHPSFQQISFMDQETGECGDRRLNHSDGEAERFYTELKQRGANVRVGMEATGHSRWFERLLAELGFELWTGDPAELIFGPLGAYKDPALTKRLVATLGVGRRGQAKNFAAAQ